MRSFGLSCILCGMLLVGCGGGGGSGPSPVVGSWLWRSVQVDQNMIVPCPGTATVPGGTVTCGANAVVVIRADGTFIDDGGLQGTWTMIGNQLTITSLSHPITVTVNVQGKLMTQRFTSGNSVILYVFERL
jgi:hypothetical protein